MSEYVNIGAGWINEDGSITVKIEKLGLNARLWKNTRKQGKQPDWNMTCKRELAETLGLIQDNTAPKAEVADNGYVGSDGCTGADTQQVIDTYEF
jgi:hypothetical protein